MIDLGKKPEVTEAVPAKDSSPEKYYPSLHISLPDGVDIPDEMLNKEMKITAIVKITGYNKSKNNNYSSNSLDMEFHQMDFGGNKKYDSIFEAIMASPDASDESED